MEIFARKGSAAFRSVVECDLFPNSDFNGSFFNVAAIIDGAFAEFGAIRIVEEHP
jgi:hypothetical protein